MRLEHDGTRLRAIREARGRTSKDLGASAGISASAILKFETEAYGASRTTLQRVAHALGVHVDALLRPEFTGDSGTEDDDTAEHDTERGVNAA